MHRIMRALLAVATLGAFCVAIVAADVKPAAAAPATAVTLTASASYVPEYTWVTLTATANGDLAEDQYLDIFDATTGTLICSEVAPATQCQVDVSEAAGTHYYVAYIDTDPDGTNFPPNGIVATSNTVGVTWYALPPEPRPSDTYCSATTPIIDGTVAGVYTKLAVQTGSPNAVCFRVDGLGVGFGGALTIGTPGIGVPTLDSDLSACTVELVDILVVGKPVFVGYGTTSTDVSVCVQVDTTIVRVRIPTSGDPGIHLYLDPGSTLPSIGTDAVVKAVLPAVKLYP